MAKTAKSTKTPKKAPVTPIRPAAPMQPVAPVMTEEEIVARNAMRAAANIRGARLVTGDFIIGKKVNGGLQEVFTIILQPVQTPTGTNMPVSRAIISLKPMKRVAMTGRPIAIASFATTGPLSRSPLRAGLNGQSKAR